MAFLLLPCQQAYLSGEFLVYLKNYFSPLAACIIPACNMNAIYQEWRYQVSSYHDICTFYVVSSTHETKHEVNLVLDKYSWTWGLPQNVLYTSLRHSFLNLERKSFIRTSHIKIRMTKLSNFLYIFLMRKSVLASSARSFTDGWVIYWSVDIEYVFINRFIVFVLQQSNSRFSPRTRTYLVWASLSL